MRPISVRLIILPALTLACVVAANGWAQNMPAGAVPPIEGSRMLLLLNDQAPDGMVAVPAGSFAMGNAMAGEGDSDELPAHTVTCPAFYMDRGEVTLAQWSQVYAWAIQNGYTFSQAGSGKATNHPVHTVTWFDAVKWCNARSEMTGRTPVYTANSATLKTGTPAVVTANWDNKGYRLPTEAEWEYAARGGVAGHRFSWADTDNIDHNHANYRSLYPSATEPYDLGPAGYDPVYGVAPTPYTSPAGSYAANGLGVMDMTGNLMEWCWDWYGSGYYTTSPSTSPRGPDTGTYRVLRSGSWSSSPKVGRVANRSYDAATMASATVGFRCVCLP